MPTYKPAKGSSKNRKTKADNKNYIDAAVRRELSKVDWTGLAKMGAGASRDATTKRMMKAKAVAKAGSEGPKRRSTQSTRKSVSPKRRSK
jgi:hypothetical protein